MNELRLQPWPEVQDLLPPLSASEQRALRESISRDGIRIPILVLPDGRIIDGHHRWAILGIETAYTVVDLPEDRAFALGLALNIARRQLGPEQLREIQERLRKDRDLQRQTAAELRHQGMSQEQAAAVVGVARRTVDEWEEPDSGRNVKNDNASADPPDQRLSIPRAEHETIWARHLAGESNSAIAADYKVTGQRIGQAPKQEDALRNTDLIVLGLDALRIACRVRRYQYLLMPGYAEQFTIRAERPRDTKTELTKIIEGWGDYFLYGFANEAETDLAAWTLGDLKVFRLWFNRQIVQKRGELPGTYRGNHDGSSGFRVFRIGDMPSDFVVARRLPPEAVRLREERKSYVVGRN